MSTALSGRTAVVTGASSGIGLAVAQSLARAGMNLVLGARSSEKLDAVARGLGGAATPVLTDVTSETDTAALVRAAVDRHGGIDVLVANAGVYMGGEFAGGDLRGFLDLIDTNVGGVIRTVHAALEHMVPAGTGDIVITSSISGHQAIYWEPVYTASKHAVQALTHALRRQLVGSGVRIGAVAPGIVLNDLWKVSDDEEVAAGVEAGTGLRSEDVADAVVYMLTRPRHVNIRDLVLLPINQEL
ncbi:MAG: SDR family oxidoreductase [Acidimicrobiales bacterium]|jgi:ribitol 2-dehydrogenase